MRLWEGIALAITSSGVAPLLADGGQTAHKFFQTPVPINGEKLCRIDCRGPKADLIRQAELIIWDEALMRALRQSVLHCKIL